jgi:hypothetical protein
MSLQCPVCEFFDLVPKRGQAIIPGPVTFVCPLDGFEIVCMLQGDPGWPRKP